MEQFHKLPLHTLDVPSTNRQSMGASAPTFLPIVSDPGGHVWQVAVVRQAHGHTAKNPDPGPLRRRQRHGDRVITTDKTPEGSYSASQPADLGLHTDSDLHF